MEDKIKHDKRWKILAIISFILFVVLFIFSIYFFVTSNTNLDKNYNFINPNNHYDKKNIKDDICDDCVRGAIDGVYTEKTNANLYPFAIIIDNNVKARPAFGLSKAKLVYESEVEGGITRYLAIFDDISKIKKIGPIRSVRPYFIDWSKELSATLVHCGGSPSALAQIIKKDIDDLNEFYNETYFYRDNEINAPHNVFTTKENLEKYLDKKGLKNSKILSYKFKKDTKKTERLGLQGIKIGFKEGYGVKWGYDEIENSYIRYLNKNKHIDGDNEQIIAKNIIVQFVESEIIDEKLRLNINTIGEGDSIVCLDGECLDSVWKKEKSENRTRYFVDDEEVEFNAGMIWVEVVRDSFKDSVIY